MTAWEHYKRLPLRMKVAVAIAAPLWLPVALAAWLEQKEVGGVTGVTGVAGRLPSHPENPDRDRVTGDTPSPLDLLRSYVEELFRVADVDAAHLGEYQEALAALAQVKSLAARVDELRLWEPGRKGYAAALDRVFDAHRPFAAHKDTNPTCGHQTVGLFRRTLVCDRPAGHPGCHTQGGSMWPPEVAHKDTNHA